MNVSAIDLFCGVGGLTHGVQNAGIKVVAGVDIDSSCEYAYEANNNSVFINKSITEISSQELSKLYPDEDYKVLMGCAPCQPFSSHNKNKLDRKVHKDWGLLNSFAQKITQIKPDIVSMENVPELQNQSIFKDFIALLMDEGYFYTYKIINASEYGVPQRRKRLLLLASKLGSIDFILPTHINTHVTVRSAISHLKPLEAGDFDMNDPLHRTSKLSDINKKRILSSLPGGTWKDWDRSLLPNCYLKKTGESYTSVYGRINWDDISPTLTTQFIRYGTGRYGHPEQNRALSLREGAILQSFPENYRFVKDKNYSFTSVARQIGNAVPVKLGEVIGKSILIHINKVNGGI